MRKFPILALFLFALPAFATQYYVDNCVTVGSDSNNGTSTSTPWLTLAHAIASTTTGDIVSLQGGCGFHESVVLTHGGTWNSYGTGQATINSEPAGVFTATAETGNMSEWTTTTGTGGASITADAASLYHGSYGFDVVGDGTNFAYASQTLSAVSTAWLRFYVFLPASWSLGANFNFNYVAALTNGGTTLLHIYIQQQAGGAQLHSQLNYGSFTNLGTGTFALGGWHRVDVEYVAGTGTAGQQFWFDGVSQGSIFTQTNTTQITGLQLGSISQNAQASGSHTYFDNVKVATSSTVTANNALEINGLSNVTLNNLTIGYSGDVGIYIHGGASNINVTNSTITNVDANTFNACIFQNGASGVTYSGNTILNCEDGIAVSGYTSVANTSTSILNNSLTNFGRHAIQIAPAGGTAPSGVTVQGNIGSYWALWVNDSVGVMIDGAGASNTVSYNRMFNGGTAVTQGEDYDADLASANDVFSYNIGYGSNNGCLISSGTGNKFYGNTCYNNNVGPNSDGELSLYTSAASITAENNIFYASAGKPVLNVQAGSTTGNVFNYNDWFGGSATPFSWSGTSYNFANYKTTASQDANSLNVDPKYTNPSSNIFTLQAGSPAIGAGTNLGSTYNTGLLPASTWPSSVQTGLQGSKWNIGAYVVPHLLTGPTGAYLTPGGINGPGGINTY